MYRMREWPRRGEETETDDIGLRATWNAATFWGILQGMSDASLGTARLPHPPELLIGAGMGVGSYRGLKNWKRYYKDESRIKGIIYGAIGGAIFTYLAQILGYGLGQVAGRVLKG